MRTIKETVAAAVAESIKGGFMIEEYTMVLPDGYEHEIVNVLELTPREIERANRSLGETR